MILPLGKTGVGKSTTIQLLAGADMVKNVDTHHIQASSKALSDIPGLITIVSGGST
jgi:ABC-type transport system involved in cytochrome bd biosynthesis fused ATPase/permease subunit